MTTSNRQYISLEGTDLSTGSTYLQVLLRLRYSIVKDHYKPNQTDLWNIYNVILANNFYSFLIDSSWVYNVLANNLESNISITDIPTLKITTFNNLPSMLKNYSLTFRVGDELYKAWENWENMHKTNFCPKLRPKSGKRKLQNDYLTELFSSITRTNSTNNVSSPEGLLTNHNSDTIIPFTGNVKRYISLNFQLCENDTSLGSPYEYVVRLITRNYNHYRRSQIYDLHNLDGLLSEYFCISRHLLTRIQEKIDMIFQYYVYITHIDLQWAYNWIKDHSYSEFNINSIPSISVQRQYPFEIHYLFADNYRETIHDRYFSCDNCKEIFESKRGQMCSSIVMNIYYIKHMLFEITK